MKKGMVALPIFVIFLAVFGSYAAAEESQTLTGEYVWTNRDSRGALEAIFSPSGQGMWEVSFHFQFRGEDHIYTGTAEGSLSEGQLKGTVVNESKRRTFSFEGSFEGGVFNGTHQELTEGRERRTGTLTLSG